MHAGTATRTTVHNRGEDPHVSVDVVSVQDDTVSETASVEQAEPVVGKGGALGSVLGLLARNRGRGKSALPPIRTTVADPVAAPDPVAYMETASPLAHVAGGVVAATSDRQGEGTTPRRRAH